MQLLFLQQWLRAIPFRGEIPAGRPLDRESQREACQGVDLDMLHLPRNTRSFALKVRGDSMSGAGILDGDHVILEFRDPKSGDIVAALIDGETTLKRYLVRRGEPFLKAENPRYPNLTPAHELVVQGVMVVNEHVDLTHLRASTFDPPGKAHV